MWIEIALLIVGGALELLGVYMFGGEFKRRWLALVIIGWAFVIIAAFLILTHPDHAPIHVHNVRLWYA